MEKVFFNLITNAIKFTPAGGQVKLVTEEDTDEVHISIIDNGVGISPENIGKLFTTYFQVSNGQTEHAGYGIGLALAKSLVTLHKGRLTVDSRQAKPGEPGYTCFRVSLLKGNSYFKGTEHTARISETTLYETVINEAGVSDDFQEEKEFETVLLIEDNTELRAFIRESLEGSYTVLESPNGEEGLQVAFEEVPDIVISDIMMPGMDGLEVCQTLKKDIRTSHIPVILLTARATQDQQVEGLQTGADVYVTKPFSIQVLQLQIANLLASREAMRKRYTQQITLQPRNIAINNADEEFLHQAIDIIEEWMDDEQFGVGMLSHKLAMSQPVLYRKLKALTGMSVNDFIKSIKLKKAAQLLKQKQLTVNEVAFSVGFNDRKYFSREFKKQFGKTPSEYADLENE